MLLLDFYPKKSKGQNFLVDKNIIKKIISNISLSKDEVLLEIGSGYGVITRELASYAKKVIAVELDKKLYAYLMKDSENLENIEFVNKNILKLDLGGLLKKLKIWQKIKVFGNIPYNITSPILEYIFENKRFIDTAYLMVQKEFAQRLIAKPNTKEYSSITCFAQFHAKPTVLFSVKKTCFRPKPKVDSCFIKLEPNLLEKNSFELVPKNKKLLFKIIHSAFNKRRKNILNSLSSIIDKDQLLSILLELDIDARSRAENISLTEYVKISNLCFDTFGGVKPC
ncbi:MAG: 16S rRNA (adenine(1518)-N(6)/adenine(1519)-N(6))-dimethyltransferase RsmA [Candidatus Omnitrophota bacterium]